MTFDFYKNIQLAQTPGAKEFISGIIQEFDCVIEIGTLHGGLTLFINDHKNPESEFITFDINHTQLWAGLPPPPGSENIKFETMDCFSETAKKIISSKLSNNKTLLLCDGGSKNYEFNVYSEFLKSGSAIMLHDYIDDSIPEYWPTLTREKDWTAIPESNYSGIKEKVLEYGLIPYRYEQAYSVFWGSFIKP